MTKHFLISLLATVVLTTATLAGAQQPAKLFRIGYLTSAYPATESSRAEGIRMALRERGYVEGQNLAIVYRYAEQNEGRGRELVTELVTLKVDIILVAGGSTWVRAAKNATKTIPIVMANMPVDPVGASLVDSLARPGGNVTGVYLLTRELGGKRLELLKEAVGKLTRVAVLNDPRATGTTRELKEDIPAAARALKLTTQIWDASDADQLEKVFAAPSKQRPDGLYVTTNALFRNNQKPIVDFTVKNRLPSIHADRPLVEAGGLLYYGADITESYRRVAYFVDRILKGAKPADLPVEQPTKFEFIVNLKTAKQIGVTIPPEVLARATNIIR
jgi:putative ABC transport system substrate-binding protein